MIITALAIAAGAFWMAFPAMESAEMMTVPIAASFAAVAVWLALVWKDWALRSTEARYGWRGER